MTSIYIDTARLKSYFASSKGGKSLIKIELETADPYDLADILRQLDAIDAKQKSKEPPAPRRV